MKKCRITELKVIVKRLMKTLSKTQNGTFLLLSRSRFVEGFDTYRRKIE